MIVQSHDPSKLREVVVVARNQCLDRSVTRREVVETRRVNEFAARTAHTRGLGVVGHEFERENLVWAHIGNCLRAEFGRHEFAQFRTPFEAGHRHEVTLLVELHAFASNFGLQVNRQIGDAQQGTREIEKNNARAVRTWNRDAPRERKVAVKPGREKQAAIRFDGKLVVTVSRHIGQRLHPQVRRVGVRANDPVTTLGRHRLADVKGNDAAFAAHDVRLASRREFPNVHFVEAGVVGGAKSSLCFAHRVVGRRRSVNKCKQIGYEIFHAGSIARKESARQTPRLDSSCARLGNLRALPSPL